MFVKWNQLYIAVLIDDYPSHQRLNKEKAQPWSADIASNELSVVGSFIFIIYIDLPNFKRIFLDPDTISLAPESLTAYKTACQPH